METDSATLRPVLAGTRTAAAADGLLPSAGTVTGFPGLRLLGLDAHGRALDWMSWQDATCLYVRGAVAWTLGDPCLEIHGGISRASGEQSRVQLHPIIARDQGLCLYCGRECHRGALTRDHVQPVSRGGRDTWENVVSACFHCNSRKGNRTPQQAGMPLLAVPYRPSWIEHLILSNRNILSDQMEFLVSHLPRDRRLHA